MNPTRDDIRFAPETNVYLSGRTINTLLRGGYQTVNQLIDAKAEDLLKIKGFGFQGLEEVASWREAVLVNNVTLYQDTHQAVSKVLRSYGSEVSDAQAVAVMRTVWEEISRGPLTAARIRQMFVPPQIQS